MGGLLCALLVGCTSPKQGMEPFATLEPSTIVTPQASGYLVESIPLYEVLALAPGEEVQILSASGNRLLLNIFSPYAQGDLLAREEGYSSFTRALVVYDWKQGVALSTENIAGKGFCPSGTFAGEAAAYLILYPNKEGLTEQYEIVKGFADQRQVITSGSCTANGYSDPRLVGLENGAFAYSYFNYETGAFGVNLVSAQGEESPQIAFLEEEDTEHLRTTLVGNGESYLYYAAVAGEGTIFLGSMDEGVSQFSLPKNQRIYDYCFLMDTLFFTMEVHAGENAEKKIIVKGRDGADLAQQPQEALYRLASDNNDTVLGIDGGYHVYLCSVAERGITVNKTDLPAAPVIFYPVGEGQFLLHYNSTYQQMVPQLLHLTLQ